MSAGFPEAVRRRAVRCTAEEPMISMSNPPVSGKLSPRGDVTGVRPAHHQMGRAWLPVAVSRGEKVLRSWITAKDSAPAWCVG
jgi:hypothetical protein